MMVCDRCHNSTNSGHACNYNGKTNATLCDKCDTEYYQEKIESRLTSIKEAADFKQWSSQDLSEAFWIHLGKYVKRPNRYSITIIVRALLWACHADHGLSNSFSNALDWCKIDWVKEKNRKDLPEE